MSKLCWRTSPEAGLKTRRESSFPYSPSGVDDPELGDALSLEMLELPSPDKDEMGVV